MKKITKQIKLTEREVQVIDLILSDKTTKEIGALLSISPRTVESTKCNIMIKLGVNTSVGMILSLLDNKLFNLKDY